MHSAVMQSLWSSKLDNMLCGNFRLTGPDSSCTDFCTSCSRTCNHSAVMQSLWSSKLHNMLCRDFWLTGPNFSRTEFCTSCSRTCKCSAVRLSFWSSYTVCCAEVSDQLVQTFHHLMQKSPSELERENSGFSADGTQGLCPQHHATGLYSSVQFELVSVYSEKSKCSPPCLPEVSVMSSLKLFCVHLTDDGPLSSFTVVTQVS